MNTIITVRKTKAYGYTVYQPICQQAKFLAMIANTSNISIHCMVCIKAMGFTVNELEN